MTQVTNPSIQKLQVIALCLSIIVSVYVIFEKVNQKKYDKAN